MAGSTADLSVSIIICTYARAELLGQTLLSLRDVEGIGEAEVIVVDNNSPDHTAEVVSHSMKQLNGTFVRIRYLFEPRQGLSAARNAGIAASTGAIVAFLDDDAIPSPQWLDAIRKAFEAAPEAAAVGGVIRPSFEIARPEWLIKELELPFTIVDLGGETRSYPGRLHPFGANMAMRRSVLDRLGLFFPEELGRKGASLLSGEETWLFNQMRSAGLKLLYVPGMAVTHFIMAERLSPGWIKRRYYYQGVSNAMEARGAARRARLIVTIALKWIYISFGSAVSRSPGRKLLKACRLESIRGSVDAIRSRNATPAYE